MMAERTPVVKKYRDALENVIGATMEFLAQAPPTMEATTKEPQNPPLSAATSTPSATDLPNSLTSFSAALAGSAPESFVRSTPKRPIARPKTAHHTDPGLAVGELYDPIGRPPDPDAVDYMPEIQNLSPKSTGRWEGRHGELGQMDAEWLLSLCEGDGFDLQMLNEMMRFEPSLGA